VTPDRNDLALAKYYHRAPSHCVTLAIGTSIKSMGRLDLLWTSWTINLLHSHCIARWKCSKQNAKFRRLAGRPLCALIFTPADHEFRATE